MSIHAHNETVSHAHIALPCETLPLVLELVTRLGGEYVAGSEDRLVVPPMPEHERIGRMVRGLRLRANMTQIALAKAIGVPQRHISEYESNKRPVPVDKVALLAEILNTVETHFIPR